MKNRESIVKILSHLLSQIFRKMKLLNILLIYFFVINLYAYILYAIDKYKSKKMKWRISEKTLIIAAAIGGSIGALLAMNMFHHKTQHKKFTIGIPLILMAQVVLLILIFVK